MITQTLWNPDLTWVFQIIPDLHPLGHGNVYPFWWPIIVSGTFQPQSIRESLWIFIILHQNECRPGKNQQNWCGSLWGCSGWACHWKTPSWTLESRYTNNTPPIVSCPMGSQSGFVLDETAIWVSYPLKWSYWHGVILSISLSSPNQGPAIIIFMSTNLISYIFHKVYPVGLIFGFIECEGIISCLYVGSKGVSEDGNIFWKGLGYFFMVEHLVCKKHCLWKNRIGGRYGHICEEGNEAKNLGIVISLLAYFLNCLDSP